MHPQLLRITNGLLVLSYIFFLQFSDKPAMEVYAKYILSICLLITLSFDDKSSPDKSLALRSFRAPVFSLYGVANILE